MKALIVAVMLVLGSLFAQGQAVAPNRVLNYSRTYLWSINEWSAVSDQFRQTNYVHGRVGNQSIDRNAKQYVIKSGLTGYAVKPKTNFFVIDPNSLPVINGR